MSEKDVNVIVLAAGNGSRMRSNLPKVLHNVAGKAMIDWVLDAVSPLHPAQLITITGVGAQAVKAHVGDRSDFVTQEKQLGTGHAVQQAYPQLKNSQGVTLIMAGDTPMFRTETLSDLVAEHQRSNSAVTVLTALAEDPTGYGRIVRGDDGSVLKIVEQKDASVTERRIREINTGVYVFDNQLLFDALTRVKNDNVQGEFYLPDTLDILRQAGHTIRAHQLHDFTESLGVNDRVALAVANETMFQRINRQHMLNGVELVDPKNTYIDAGVVIGQDTLVEPGVTIQGQSVIGADSTITHGSRILDSQIGDRTTVTNSQIEASVVGDDVTIGPYAHLRPNAELADKVHIGNYVEVKSAQIGEASKVGHLTYVGNATVGKDVNIGAGTIFVNYDGVHKFHTEVGDRAFIGSNTKIIAPVKIGDEAITAAGSTITDDVPKHAMGIARGRQQNKADFWDRMPHKKDS
ncbi:bifunctional UDP-N-acetylglucosamine diphosphorylase/glucosamine-1-phosphate N-acetyltransferase GlmU [Leuconostocaceae bacterium ESL0723]|nr:bifunctional UDP-N-acetylglucosamine diphosphorylase/glucosamine-1-phosphate N-acetyltransferase GlmU [Leuconostocaceae bacterium ESL0723]